MLDVLAAFVRELRASGLPVSLPEDLDAMEALRHVPLADREAFKGALAATLVKSQAHRRTFDTVFDVFFSLRPAGETGPEGPALAAGPAEGGVMSGDGERAEVDVSELAAEIEAALREGDDERLRALAARAVTHAAGMAPGRPMGGSYYLYRTLRGLDLDGALERLVSGARSAAGRELTPLEERLARDRFETRVQRFREEVEREIRRRLVADRGAEALARTLRKPLPEDLDVMHASREELVALRQALQPLARKLAVRLARRRRHRRRGHLDYRRTVRQSMSYGGVPAEPRFRRPHPAKPEIVVIADISGSVAAFARFTLQFVHAISSQFSRVRSFVFIDGVDEVTRLFERAEDMAEAVQRVNAEADVVWVDGHSDYGHALGAFWGRWGEEISSRTTVIFLGDARNNYHAAEDWVVAAIRRRARHVYWLNPEPRSYWDTGDSIVGRYAAHCDGVFECRSLRQLARFVEQLG
ncbi:MAG TPA: VWA domain-containing protein [Acidimicrobiales bacterium]|nr:VWA domain-containing protein [Acidimicrobiales bacterium]